MEFTIYVKDVNRLYAFSKAHKIDGLIQCNIDHGILRAELLCDKGCTQFLCKVKTTDSGNFWMCPPPKKFKGKDNTMIQIADNKDSTAYASMECTTTVQKPSHNEYVNDLDKYFKADAKATIYFNPKLLLDNLTPYKDSKAVKLEVIGPKDGMYISDNEGGRTYILPVRVDAF